MLRRIVGCSETAGEGRATIKWYYGTDTNQATPLPDCGGSPHFYLGRLGGELSAGGGGLDGTALEALAPHHCFAYWDLAGPDSKSRTDTFSNWGKNQAEAFFSRWAAKSSAIAGSTLFFDIEPGNGGWLAGGTATEQAFNRDVLYGALRVLESEEHGTRAGIYISCQDWDTYFGQAYASPIPFVFWLAGTNCPTDCASAQNVFPVHTRRGGYQVMIWQYRVPGCEGNQDLNITPYNGFLDGQWRPTRLSTSG